MLPYKELGNKDDDNEYIRCIYEAAAMAAGFTKPLQ
jgi:hypothetical protein